MIRAAFLMGILGGGLAPALMLARGPGRPPLRSDAQSVLASERRRAILDAIEAHPGLPVRELGRLLDIAGGVLDHHLDKLKEAALIETRTSGNLVLLYAAGRAPAEGDPALLTPTQKDIARFIIENRGCTSPDLARNTGLSRSRVKQHLRTLTDAGLVRSEREGLHFRYYATELLESSRVSHQV